MSLARLVVTAVRIAGQTKAEVARDYGVSRMGDDREPRRGQWPEWVNVHRRFVLLPNISIRWAASQSP